MTTVRHTHAARMRVTSVMRRQRARKHAAAAAPDTRTPLEKRLDEMRRNGTLVRPAEAPQRLGLVLHIPGALERFLAER